MATDLSEARAGSIKNTRDIPPSLAAIRDSIPDVVAVLTILSAIKEWWDWRRGA